jgi:predicted amidohydrolase YtcJ
LPADVVVRNARVFTGDPARPAATATAIRGSVFVAVGDDHDVAAYVGPATRVFDAINRRMIPGLNDSHLHVIRGGLNYLLELRWDGVRSLRQGLAMLREHERTPKGQWIRVVGGLDRRSVRRAPPANNRRTERRRSRDTGVRSAPVSVSALESGRTRSGRLHRGLPQSSRWRDRS